MQQPRAMAQAYENGYKAGAAAEREAIAQSLDKQADLACDEIDRQWAQEMAAAVRARSNT
jgi:flagellar biosynthesis/type III secretory pathway protein FliH